MPISEKIYALRKERSLSQKQLAEGPGGAPNHLQVGERPDAARYQETAGAQQFFLHFHWMNWPGKKPVCQ